MRGHSQHQCLMGLHGEGCRVALHLNIPVGRSPDIRRKRPYTIGGSADVEAAQSLYPSSIPYQATIEGKGHDPRHTHVHNARLDRKTGKTS
jgi:hypothetical protein